MVTDTWHTTLLDRYWCLLWLANLWHSLPTQAASHHNLVPTTDCAVHSRTLTDTSGGIQECLWYMAT